MHLDVCKKHSILTHEHINTNTFRVSHGFLRANSCKKWFKVHCILKNWWQSGEIPIRKAVEWSRQKAYFSFGLFTRPSWLYRRLIALPALTCSLLAIGSGKR